ncbi:hypothetical protein B0H14DRAFT_3155697 [Mycena olivaceomarginata]|nr:hypothetical protein B0H14DRAFT_3155697 [Mycena olivaceomarginata]
MWTQKRSKTSSSTSTVVPVSPQFPGNGHTLVEEHNGTNKTSKVPNSNPVKGSFKFGNVKGAQPLATSPSAYREFNEWLRLYTGGTGGHGGDGGRIAGDGGVGGGPQFKMKSSSGNWEFKDIEGGIGGNGGKGSEKSGNAGMGEGPVFE